MSSKALPLVFLTAGAALLGAAPGRPENPPPDLVSVVFEDPPPAAALAIRGELAEAAASILGHPYPEPTAHYWRAGDRTVWKLAARGRSDTIVAAFAITEGRIEGSAVLEYRERRGRGVGSPRFLRQFTGASLRNDRSLDRRIDALTGATQSSLVLANLARLALFLDSFASAATP